MSNGIKTRKFGLIAGLAALFGGAVALSGCYATAGAEVPSAEVDVGVPVVQADVVPVTIETYPHVYYRGSYAYLVDGRWYYRSRARGWVIMREEPTELARYRATYVTRSRPARAPGYAYPPERRTYRPYR